MAPGPQANFAFSTHGENALSGARFWFGPPTWERTGVGNDPRPDIGGVGGFKAGPKGQGH